MDKLDKSYCYLGKNTYRSGGISRQIDEYLHYTTKIPFALVPGGIFSMGSPDNEEHRFAKEGPIREVAVHSFLMAKYPTTQEVWQRIMGENPAHFRGARHPVECVGWRQCIEFCERTQLNLPSEAQWEYACRAGTQTRYYWGDEWNRAMLNSASHWAEKDLLQQEWVDLEFGKRHRDFSAGTTEVGRFPPNAFGLFDMLGNVWEWCLDIFQRDYQGAAADDRPRLEANDECSSRVFRGSAWLFSQNYCRCAVRFRNHPAFRNYFVGFRVVDSLE